MGVRHVVRGGDDVDTATLADLGAAEGDRFEIEVVEGELLHASANPSAQRVTAERIVAWARRHLDAAADVTDHGVHA